jgi:hypothetical protein
MTTIRTILSVSLLFSAVIGTSIVLTDAYLWSAAPTHALGLIGFITLDIALAIALSNRISLASLLSIGLSAVQAIAMLGDILAYSTPDVPQKAFRAYLLNSPAFMALLVVQLVILALAIGATNLRYEYKLIQKWIQLNLPHQTKHLPQ